MFAFHESILHQPNSITFFFFFYIKIQMTYGESGIKKLGLVTVEKIEQQ